MCNYYEYRYLGLYQGLIWPDIWPITLLDTGYPAGRISGWCKKNRIFSFSFFPFSSLSFNFLYSSDKKTVVIAHNIYNFVYTSTGYPISSQPDIQQMKLDIRPGTKKGRISGQKSGRPDIWYNPDKYLLCLMASEGSYAITSNIWGKLKKTSLMDWSFILLKSCICKVKFIFTFVIGRYSFVIVPEPKKMADLKKRLTI